MFVFVSLFEEIRAWVGFCIYHKYLDILKPYKPSWHLNNSIGLPIDLSKTWWMSGKQCRPWSDAAFSGIWSGAALFAQVCLSKYLGKIQ